MYGNVWYVMVCMVCNGMYGNVMVCNGMYVMVCM